MRIPINRLVIDRCRAQTSVSFKIKTADWIPEPIRDNLENIHRTRLSPDGTLTIRSNKTDKSTLNLADCLDRLRCYISEAAQPPEPDNRETIEMRREKLDRAAVDKLAEIQWPGVL